MQLSVVIPVFNESELIAGTITAVKSFLQEQKITYEIIVVDDCSVDSTLKILSTLADIKILRNLKNHGKGYSVAKGVRIAQGEWILFIDADNSTPFSELKKIWSNRQAQQLLIASRALPESIVKVRQSFIKVFLGRLGNLLVRWILGTKIKDTQCGFKLFSRDVQPLFQQLTIARWGFDFELIFLAEKHKFKVKEFPVVWINEPHSKVRWYSYLQTLGQVFKVRFNSILNKYH